MAPPRRLSQLPFGVRATVRGFPGEGSIFIRLREMGVLPGTALTLVRAAPLGDPLEIQVRGCSLMLRKSEAEQIMVEAEEES